ncbi:coenzyme F420 hydrogenase subunit delta [Thermodesulfatator atlanticus]|uniref:coenzyme F420 hydrogenase subunit delta n=1 Tax=Thermodesulfatator atlanticus TaxID=501497 RepID=UPI0003B681FD|nr:coenzyme F420 hydrogenase subunit delta [Thermodesulfatator atlanticus]
MIIEAETILIGLGHLLKGDLGISYYIIEALALEGLEKKAKLVFLAEETEKLDVFLFKKKEAIIIVPAVLNLKPGKILCWDYDDFLKRYPLVSHIQPYKKIYDSFYLLKLIDALPKDITIISISVEQTRKAIISIKAIKAARKVINIVKRKILEENIGKVSRIYSVKDLISAKNLVF